MCSREETESRVGVQRVESGMAVVIRNLWSLSSLVLSLARAPDTCPSMARVKDATGCVGSINQRTPKSFQLHCVIGVGDAETPPP